VTRQSSLFDPTRPSRFGCTRGREGAGARRRAGGATVRFSSRTRNAKHSAHHQCRPSGA
jgi:hypothetical protein